jgi:hypothetical protein
MFLTSPYIDQAIALKTPVTEINEAVLWRSVPRKMVPPESPGLSQE